MSDTRGKHPNSLANLKAGVRVRKGARYKMTKGMVEKSMDYLQSNHAYFIQCMNELSPQQYVMAYLKIMDLTLPKKQEINTNSEDLPVFVINAVEALPEPSQAAIDAAREDKNEDDD